MILLRIMSAYALFSFFIEPLSGENIYLLFDQTCMDRLEYGYGFTPAGQEYVKYHVKISPTEMIVFEVGPENNSPKQNYLSAATIGCSDEALSRQLVQNQRNNQTEVFIVRQVNGNQYQISKVNNSSYFRRDNQGVQYDSWQMSFNHLGGLKEGENLTPNSTSGVNIIYNGTSPYECTDAYFFKRTYDYDPKSYSEVFFLPNLGIVEERPFPGGPEGIYKLRAVNGKSFESVLKEICQANASLSSNFLSGGASGAALPSQPTQAYHDVLPGETLYSISRQHNVSVDDLKNWNDMNNSSMVRVGQKVRIIPPEGTAAATSVATDNGFNWSGSDNQADAGTIQPFGSPGSAASPPPNAGMTPPRSGTKAWETTNGYHKVVAGETVALLALKYGYTEDRFRYMNKLGPNDVLMVGQTVNTTDCQGSTGTSSLKGVSPNNDAIQATPPPPPSPAPAQDALGTTFTSDANPATGYVPFTPPASDATSTASSPATPPPTGNTPTSFEPYSSRNTPDFGNMPPKSGDFGNSNSMQPFTQPSASGNGSQSPPPGGATLPTYQGGQATPPPPAREESPQQPALESSSFGTPITPYQPGSSSNTSVSPSYNSNSTPPSQGNSNTNPTLPPSYNTYNTSGTPNTNASSNTEKITHVVQEGETIETIARQYNTTPDKIRQVNGIGQYEILIPTQKIKIN